MLNAATNGSGSHGRRREALLIPTTRIAPLTPGRNTMRVSPGSIRFPQATSETGLPRPVPPPPDPNAIVG